MTEEVKLEFYELDLIMQDFQPNFVVDNNCVLWKHEAGFSVCNSYD